MSDYIPESAMTQPTPPPRCRDPQQVGCENAQGTLNIHLESERCEVCERRVSGERRKRQLNCNYWRGIKAVIAHFHVHLGQCSNQRKADRRKAGK